MTRATSCHVPGCARPCADAFVCTSCTRQLEQDLQRIITGHQRPAPAELVVDEDGREHRMPREPGWIGRDLSTPFDHNGGLLADLVASYVRSTRVGNASGARSAETPLVWHEKAGELRQRLCGTLARYARIVADARQVQLPEYAEPLILADWLLRHVPWLRHQAAGANAVVAIGNAVRDITRIIDPVVDRVYAGPCSAAPLPAGDCPCSCHVKAKQRPLCDDAVDGCYHHHADDTCGRDLYAEADATEITCPACHQLYDAEKKRAGLLEALHDVLATATEISRALTSLDQPVTPDRIWKWKQRGRLTQRGTTRGDDGGDPMYRLGDVSELVTEAAVAAAKREARRAG